MTLENASMSTNRNHVMILERGKRVKNLVRLCSIDNESNQT